MVHPSGANARRWCLEERSLAGGQMSTGEVTPTQQLGRLVAPGEVGLRII